MTLPKAFTPIQKTLHWLIAVAVIFMIFMGFIMVSIPDSDIKWFYYMIHKSFGTIIFLLMMWRIYLRMKYSAPAYPSSLSPFHLMLAKLSVPVLYIAILTMLLSGIIMSIAGGYDIDIFNIITIPALNSKMPGVAGVAHWIHVNGVFLVIAILVMHVGAAFYHHFILKNAILGRMMPKVRNDQE